MLPSALSQLKQSLEKELHLDDDDKRSLHVLRILENDPKVQQLLTENVRQVLTKSFVMASSVCPCCGKTL